MSLILSLPIQREGMGRERVKFMSATVCFLKDVITPLLLITSTGFEVSKQRLAGAHSIFGAYSQCVWKVLGSDQRSFVELLICTAPPFRSILVFTSGALWTACVVRRPYALGRTFRSEGRVSYKPFSPTHPEHGTCCDYTSPPKGRAK